MRLSPFALATARTAFTLPSLIDWALYERVSPGTKFQNEVWKVLQSIPYGETRSYKAQSIKLGNVKAVRAVANANGDNRISIIIPCHRVIGEDGKLVGYGGGLWRKQWLLKHEKSNLS